MLLGLIASAQTTREEIQANPERAAGIYHSYEYTPGATAPAPKGYKPFYISHYGRHGSRWHSSQEAYTKPLATLQQAADKQLLTAQGEAVLQHLRTLEADAKDRYGDLSPRGVVEHRGIAERMYAAYPEVFSTRHGRTCRIESRSTLVPRCILSMAAFNERLKELNPEIQTTRESSARYLGYMSRTTQLKSQYEQATAVADSMAATLLHPERLMQTLFTDPSVVKKPRKLMQQLFAMAAITQDVNYLGISLYPIFTDEELYALWQSENIKRYLVMGPSSRFGDGVIADARPLLRNIIETADSVLAGKTDLAASLRFGHDTNIVPLLALMGVKKASARVWAADEICGAWSVEKVSPMGVNLQLIFFRNPQGDIRVRVLHNERDAQLPIEGAPYYPWESLRSYLESRLSGEL